MKVWSFSLLISCLPFVSVAQGAVQLNTNSFIIPSNGCHIVLNDIGILNNGTINCNGGNNVFHLTGNKDVYFSGSGTTTIDQLEMNKTSSKLTLQQSFSIVSFLKFSRGLIDLSNYSIDLKTTGALTSESEVSRIYSSGTGYIQSTSILNNPNNANPGNLGAVISSSQNLGTVTVRRSHQSQTAISGGSILRNYDIIPSNNTALNASLSFYYFDAELNGIDENSATMWTSTNSINWTELNPDSRDLNANRLVKTGINNFSHFTLANPSSALPLKFISFAGTCIRGRYHLIWKTALEVNVEMFRIEESTEEGQWVLLGTVKPSNGYQDTNYSFTTTVGGEINTFYRVIAVDKDGKKTYSPTIKLDCKKTNDEFLVWPNPVQSLVNISIHSETTDKAVLTLFDATGRKILEKEVLMLQGQNSFSLDMSSLSSGTFYIHIQSRRKQKSIKLIKE